MATPAQIEANRRNAQRSTGPRSVEGKAVSRFNALKSGIDAKSLAIPGEDPAELEALVANYYLQFPAATPVEAFLVDAIIQADWQLRRLRKVEAGLWLPQFAEDDGPLGKPLTRLHRRIDAAERSYYRALKELQAQIAARAQARAEAESDPVTAAAPELGSLRHLAAPPELAAMSPSACDQLAGPKILAVSGIRTSDKRFDDFRASGGHVIGGYPPTGIMKMKVLIHACEKRPRVGCQQLARGRAVPAVSARSDHG